MSALLKLKLALGPKTNVCIIGETDWYDRQTQNHITHTAETKIHVQAACCVTENETACQRRLIGPQVGGNIHHKAFHLGNVGLNVHTETEFLSRFGG
jgi:hypothetical protein